MWISKLIFLTLLLFTSAAKLTNNPFINIPFKPLRTSAERIKEHGYPSESHYVETEDGYVLNIFRIPYSPKLNNVNAVKPIVFIMHGLFSCSDGFLLNGPDNAVAYNFADAGFDVWLGNARGNIYSRNNTKISLNHPSFWHFSWHEIGAMDLPAMIDYILELTAQNSLHYVGHSQGGTVFHVLTSFLPEYNEKIKTAHLLAPAVFMGNASDGFITDLAPYFGEPGTPTQLLCDQQFLPSNPYLVRILDTLCNSESRFPEYCELLFVMWAGNDQSNLNATLLPQLAETHPAGISSNQGIHFIQLFASNKFRRYDYGVQKNLKYYKQEYPPDYPLEKITTNTYYYYGLGDTSANAADLQRLPQIIPNIKKFQEVEDPTWGHLDFVFALQVKEVINDPIIEDALQYERMNNLNKNDPTFYK